MTLKGGESSIIREYVGKSDSKVSKSQKRPVIAYADNYTQVQYFLASFADDIYLNPLASWYLAVCVRKIYFKSMIEKLLKLHPHIFRVGTYKSAVELFCMG